MADISSLINQPDVSSTENMASNATDDPQQQQTSVKEEEEDVPHDVSMIDGSNDRKDKKVAADSDAQAQATASPSRDASTAPTSAVGGGTLLRDNGDPIRAYVNARLTPHLTAGLKVVARSRPQDPLRVLGNYLIAAADKYEWNPPFTTLKDGKWAHVDNPGAFAVANPEAIARGSLHPAVLARFNIPSEPKDDDDDVMEED